MNENNAVKILELLNNTAEITQGDKLTPQGLAMLAELLSRKFSPAEVEAAIECHLEESPFFPVYANIAKHARNPTGEAWASWAMILEHIARHGYTNPPRLEPATQRALDAIGGYVHLCESETKQVDFLAGQFIKAFTTMQKRTEYRNALTGGEFAGAANLFAWAEDLREEKKV